MSQTPYKARLRAVRKAFSQKNAFRIQRSRAKERGLSRGNLSPLTLFWFLLPLQKKRHGGEPYRLSPFGDFSPPIGEKKLCHVHLPKSKAPGGTGGLGSDQISILP